MMAAWDERQRSLAEAIPPTLTPLPTRPRIQPATATRIPRHTATPPPTPAPAVGEEPTADGQAGTRGCVEALADPGFEAGDAWTMVHTAYLSGYVSRPAEYVSDPVRTGRRALRLGISAGADVYSYSAAEQEVTIPADVSSARLTFWVYCKSADTSGDGQYALVLKEGGGYDSLMWGLSNQSGWQEREYPLDAYKGQSIAIHFEVYNDGDGQLTMMYVDDVSLTLCHGAETAPRPTPTPLPRTSTPAP